MNADTSRAGPVERDIELAITALKKGTQLVKYGRRGKPKFCPFRLANDESDLIWISGKEEKHLKLSHVSRIIPGQRTQIFQRYSRPDKEYQSFSLIYSDRSLDLICKDKDEAEVWFTGIKALISRSHHRKGRTESRSVGFSSEASSPRTLTHRSSPLSSTFGSVDSLQKETPHESPPQNGLEKPLPDVSFFPMPPKVFLTSESATGSVHSLSSGGSDGINGRLKGFSVDTFRYSLSSAVSSSSHGSAHADADALGDVFIWGEGTSDGFLGGGVHRSGSFSSLNMDSYIPKPLESAVVLDVHSIACGGRHATLVTKQGEVFSWGEESGGRLGHGVDSDVSHPKLVDALRSINIEHVASGENHTCAVTFSGDLYTWGRMYNFGLLGHENEVSRWVPKRLSGPLEGIHVSSISCGPWHTAVVTSSGQLFTFGDGTFGVLGHGDRKSVCMPREVESLKGLRTVRAACGVWHTAAVIEVMVGSSSSCQCSSGKLFTWGDGDKGRLGHGDKEPKLVPTCVPLVEPNFCKVACGHSLTVALTTTGHVYTMGSTVYGQLGNPKSDGKSPERVEGRLCNDTVEEISCGAYHVAVCTSKTEVYTWGKGANGRLGHGDTDDRSSPSLVEALKDKQVRNIACGTNFTAAICLHKWVSGIDQSMCSGCRLAFNFKRKRHNCYNCGLVFCHSCSSKKSLKASMAPNPNKPYRTCDACFEKLRKTMQNDKSSHSALSRRGSMNQGLSELMDKDEKLEAQGRKFTFVESSKDLQGGVSKRNKKAELNNNHISPLPDPNPNPNSMLINSKTFNPASVLTSKKLFSVSLPGSRIVSRATSPKSRRSSPPRSTTPTPTLTGFESPRFRSDVAKRTNEFVSQEVLKLRAQVEGLTWKTQHQEIEIERLSKQMKEAVAIAGDEAAKCKAAKEVIKSLTAQLKEMAERLPLGALRNCKSPSFNIFSFDPQSDSCFAVTAQPGSPKAEPDSNGSNCHNMLSNVSNAAGRIKTRTVEGEGIHGAEWVEQDEPGVYITLVSLPGGVKDLKRVRFSRKRFSEKQAEQWWAANRSRVYQRYNVPMLDKSNPGIGRESLVR